MTPLCLTAARVMPIAVCGLAIAAAASAAQARIWHVAPDSSGDAPTIQSAILAAAPGDEVVLAPGTYSWTTQGGVTSISTMLLIDRPLTLRGAAGAAQTVVDAEQRGRVLLATAAVTVRDLTVRGGRAPAPFAGGGLRAIRGGLIAGCVITANECQAGASGGGLVLVDGTVEDCEIAGNFAALGARGAGATLLRSTMRRCVVRDNTAAGEGSTGAGVYSAESIIEDTRFTGNRILGGIMAAGGALHSNGDQILRCMFRRNILLPGDSQGAAVYGTPVLVADCVFIGNETPGIYNTGGALYGATNVPVERCTFVDNSSGVHNADVHRTLIVGCTTGPPCAGTGSVACSNLWRNPTTRGACAEQSGNMRLDPEFCAVDPGAGEHVALQSDSPCLQAACGAIGARPDPGCSGVAAVPIQWTDVKLRYRAVTAP